MFPVLGWRFASQSPVFAVSVVEHQVRGLFFVEIIDVLESLFGDEFILESFDTALDFRVLVWLAKRNEGQPNPLFFAEASELVGLPPRLFTELVSFVLSFEQKNKLGSVVDSDFIGLTVLFDELFEKIDDVVRAFLLVRKRKERAGTIVYSNAIVYFSYAFEAELF